MENQHPQITDRELLEEVHENTRKTKNYMKWQLIITVALVVIPLIATIALIPFALNSVSSMFGEGLLNSATQGSSTIDTSTVEDLIKQYTQ